MKQLRITRPVWLMTLLLTVVVTATLTWAIGSSRDHQAISALPGLAADVDEPMLRALDETQPLMPSGERVDLDRAMASQSGLVLPSSDAVGNLEPEYWYSSTTGEVAVRYGSKLVVEYSPWSVDQDPAQEYASQAQEWEAGQATEVDGHPAWLIPADARAEGQPPVSVLHISRGDLDVTLFGQLTIDELVKAAESLSEPATAEPGATA